MGYSIEAATADCYDGTTCLINKFGIKDDKQLSFVESQITFAKGSELENNPIKGNFDFEHYKSIHKYLFDEIYDWAGQIRKVNISKKGTKFAKADEIEQLADACFSRLKSKNYFKAQKFDEFIENITDFYCVTNMLHPFREGNGRTQRIFISQLIRNAGYDIDFLDINTDDLMTATIQASNGVDVYLKEIFANAVKQK
ncbi:MAG: Fic family protein [Acutalibacteraceae bacterium]|nr:Fic family protein [Acutalibacteraceae bacterium]